MALLALLPAFARVLLHVRHLVALVDDLQSEDRLDDVLHGQDTLETAVLVDNQGDLRLLFEHGVPDVADGFFFAEERHLAFDFAEGHVELVLGEVLQRVVAEHVAGDVFGRLGIDGDSGEVVELVVVVVFAQGHAFRRGGGHHAGRHHLLRLHIVQFDDVLDDFVLVFLDDAFLFAHVGDGEHLLAAHHGVLFFLGDQSADQLNHFHEREHEHDEHADGLAGEAHQAFPAGRADGLGDDLGEDEDEDGGDGGDEAEPAAAEQEGGLLAHAGGANGVGDGVQRQDGRERALRVRLVLLEQRGGLVAFLLAHQNVRDGGGEQARLQR